jgi:prepilin-type N-terminal cleavage/methylation domain-containing protein
MPALRGESGYSLVEMLTVMVIMGVVFAGITDVFVAGSKAQAEQDRRFQAQLSTRVAMDKLRNDIHCATDTSPYAANSVTLLRPSGCGGNVSWCTVAVSGYTDRYALYRQLGSSCPHVRVRLLRLARGRPRHQPQGQLDRQIRAHGHDLPPKQHEDLR